jgi:hypothetical protein
MARRKASEKAATEVRMYFHLTIVSMKEMDGRKASEQAATEVRQYYPDKRV